MRVFCTNFFLSFLYTFISITHGIYRNNDLADLEAQRTYRISVQLGVHAFQEYTYKKITACDVCREILRGMYFFFRRNIN